MSRVFFGKMNNEHQVAEKRYIAPNEGFLGGIQVGDYAFIKLEHEEQHASVKRLWQLINVQQADGNWEASFEEICNFNPISLQQFVALDLFVLNKDLLNKCLMQTRGLSFIKISITDENYFTNLVLSNNLENYIQDENHYRKIVKLPTERDVDNNSIHVQLYKRDESWVLVNSIFIGQDLIENFDPSQFTLYGEFGRQGTNTHKDRMYRFLVGDEYNASPIPIKGLWDLFCGRAVRENTTTTRTMMTSNIREEFIDYCKKNGVERAADKYEGGIRSMESEMSNNEISINIDDEYKKDRCQDLLNKLEKHNKKRSKEDLGNRRNWKYYINKYVEFKKSKETLNDSSDSVEKEELCTYSYSQAHFCGVNKAFYGTPGCGKSYYLENTILPEEGIDDNSVFRTTFFQDYSNTDFVGQILPKVNSDKSISYEFFPGPFSLALKCAIDNPDEKVALIIEELNRGNAPSIFGDIFQLLDRQDGESRYSIVNVNIQSYLKKESLYDLKYIKIPKNLYIFATMNTSDQNVFTLDTAFKRRWKFEKLTNEFLNTDAIGNKLVPGFNNVSWRRFVTIINEFIILHATSLSAEDKQLGKYFIDEDLLMNDMDDYSDEKLKEFAYKVFEYLWADVAKFNRADWFSEEVKSLDMLIYKFLNHEIFFESTLANDLPLYVPEEEV